MFTNNILNKVIQKVNESDLEEINKYQEKFDKILNQLDNLKSKLYIYTKTILQLKQNNNTLSDFDDIYHINAAMIEESDHAYFLNFHIGGDYFDKGLKERLLFDENMESFIIKAEILIPKNDDVVGTVNYIIKTNQSRYESDLKYTLNKYELLSDAHYKLNVQLKSFDKAMNNYIKKCEIKEPYICNWVLNNDPQPPIIFEGITNNNPSDTSKIATKHILERINYDEPASISRVLPFRDYLEERKGLGEDISTIDLYNTDKFKIIESNLKPELEDMVENYNKLIKLNTPTEIKEEEKERF